MYLNNAISPLIVCGIFRSMLRKTNYDPCLMYLLETLRSIHDVITAMDAIVNDKKAGKSMNAALGAVKKQRTSMKRVRHIYQLYVTRRAKFDEV